MELEAALRMNLASVRRRIADAANRARRDPDDIALVAVTKTVEPERILLAQQLGVTIFGENRVEEAEEKIPTLHRWLEERGDPVPSWHMIGHLQSRKSRRALELFDWIQSVDSTRLADRLSRQASEMEKVMPILLELNVSGEEAKYGFAVAPGRNEEKRVAQFLQDVEEILDLPNVKVRGLMTVAPMVENPEEARPYFRRLREWQDRLRERFPQQDLGELSMGMTDDFEVAVEEGATMLRLGRAIFGPR